MAKISGNQVALDEKKILSEIMKNSKEDIDIIAKHCGFSKQKVWRFIKHLEVKGLIWGYTAIFDEQKISMTHFILMLKRTTKPLEKATANRIISRRAEDVAAELGVTIESSSYVHGEFDWVVTFIAEDLRKARKFCDSLVALHPGEIEKIMILQTLIFIKKQYVMNPEKINLRDLL
jgi:DNA-binding Lrp family transcriptional regulator